MAFGSAQIVLTEEEFSWVNRLFRVKDQLPGGPSAKFLFFTSTPNPCKNLNSYFQEAWKSMGLPGCPTFTDVRTSIASHIKFTHTNDDRVKLSKFMCNDTRTADKFYVANLTPQQAMEHRRLFDTALEGEERGSPSKQPTSIKHKWPAKGKEPLKKKRSAPESSDKEMTSGSTTPEATKSPEYQESGTSSPESSGHEEQQDEEEEKAESGAEAVGSQDEEEETTTPKKYPRRRGKATVLLTPLKCLASTQRHVSPLKVKKAIFSPTSTTLVGLTRQKEVSKKVKEAIKKRRQRK
ncbi:histone deacetylase HDT3-like [Pimephales promelas]|uniref:histone deacetylase HDT3-like n=1 Tax=Pimephales promelas TaxID=90988 RepID=UPI0019555778|nr:histone deacetylase HDT3-like [Pimephales promelas]